MSNVGRQLTVVLTIEDETKAEWIWEGLRTYPKAGAAGVAVSVVANGELYAQLSDAEDEINRLKGKPDAAGR